MNTPQFCYIDERLIEGNELIFLSEKKPFDLLVSTHSDIYTIAVEEQLFFQNLSRHPHLQTEELNTKRYFCLKKEKEESFYNFFKKYFHYRETPDPVYADLENEMLQELLQTLCLQKKSPRHIPDYVQKARMLIKKNLHENYSIEQLADDLHVTKRALEYSFKKFIGYTPKGYQKTLRLNQARKMILNEKYAHLQIYEIALRCNYKHFSHFTSEYKKLFGETPKQTLKNRCKSL